MGGSGSVGHLHVQVENCNLQAGQEVTGVVFFKLDSHIAADSLELKFSGKEYCYWTESRSESNSDGTSSTVTDSYTGKAVIVKQIFPVFLFQGSQVAAGQYSFPFAFWTAPTLPGSFEISYGTSKAHIKYRLTAFLRTSAKVKKAKAEVRVSKRLTEAVSDVVGGVIARISTWCCIAKGTVNANIRVEKSAYMPGETAYVDVEIDNSGSSLNVREVRLTLFRSVRLTSNCGRSFVHKVKMNEIQLPQMVPAGTKLDGERRLRIALPVTDPKGEMQNVTTVHGQRIECAYIISLHAEMDGSCMCCGQRPTVERELVIYPLQLPMMPPPLAPENWNPVVMPMVQFQADYSPSAPPIPSYAN